MNIVHFEDQAWLEEGTGTRYKVLNDPEDGERCEFEMTVRDYGASTPSYTAHRHKIEQIRYVLKGDAGPTNGMSSPVGSINYIGSSTFYGPFDRGPELEYLSIKFGGTEDPARRFPKPRYALPVIVQPEHFSWRPLGNGIDARDIATFTERGTRLSFLRSSADGGRTTILIDRPTVAFCTVGAANLDGEAVHTWDGVMLDAGETATLDATGEAELLVFTLPA